MSNGRQNATRLSALTVAAVVLWTVQISGAAQVNYRNAVLGDGATAYYEFEELGDPTILIDSAGGDNNGSYVGGVGRTLASAYPSLEVAATFDGVDDRVRITDGPTFDLGTGPVTVEMWFRTATTNRGDLFTYKGGGGDFGIHSNSQNPPPAGSTGSVSPYLNNFSSGTTGAGANINEWHHLAVTRDAAGTVTTYIDGTPRLTGTDTDTLNIANDLLIGSNHGGDPANPAIPFNGAIDEVAWYPLALTQAQVQNHINQAVPEPAAAASFAAAGLFLLGWRRRG